MKNVTFFFVHKLTVVCSNSYKLGLLKDNLQAVFNDHNHIALTQFFSFST